LVFRASLRIIICGLPSQQIPICIILERKVQNLRRKNIISYSIDDPNPPYKGVRGKRKVKIHEDINHNRPIIEKIIIRSTGSLEHPMAKWACIETGRVREDIFAKLPERKNGRNLACR
jgi:hypothetical protein